MAFIVFSLTAARAETTPAAPVTFTHCRAIDGSAGFSLIAPPGTAVLDVIYRNDAAAALAAVRVALVVDGVAVATIDDVGTFAPGATVHRRFQLPTELFPLPEPPSCAAATVRYADGTTWTNAAIGASVGARLAQTPESRIGVELCRPAKTTINNNTSTDMRITFVDRAPAPATKVAFSLLAGGKRLQRFEKEGTFSPGVPIEANFTADPNIFPVRTLHPQCRVDEVRFADGTSWTNPAAPADPFGTPQQPGSPVEVVRCSTTGESRFEQNGPYNHVFVTFRSTAATAATEARFDILVNGEKVAAGAVSGTFAPNVDVKKSIAFPPSLFPLGTSLPACVATRVVYADGTSWAAPAAR